MDNRSHDKKNPLNGFIFENSGCDITKSSLACGFDTITPRIFKGKSSSQALPDGSTFLISRAYSEPAGYDMVENMLLQRDYIID